MTGFIKFAIIYLLGEKHLFLNPEPWRSSMWSNTDIFWLFWSTFVMIASVVMLFIQVTKGEDHKIPIGTSLFLLTICSCDGLMGLMFAFGKDTAPPEAIGIQYSLVTFGEYHGRFSLIS